MKGLLRTLSFLLVLTFAVGLGEARAQEGEGCLPCHGTGEEGAAPRVEFEIFRGSVHADNGCLSCHEDAEGDHPEEGVDLAPVLCGECHDETQETYVGSIHGVARMNGGEGIDAASCADCHGSHDIRQVSDPASRVFPFNLPETCGRCHGDQTLAARHNIEIPEAYQEYIRSVHGRGLLKSGLLVSATCSSCHGAHDIHPREDPRSPLHRGKVIDTCGRCHVGVKDEFLQSVHGQAFLVGNEKAPVCTGCHTTHEIGRVDEDRFRLHLSSECGTCHQDLMETYGETYHGKATHLGAVSVAKCSDCHGYHGIRPMDDPSSRIHPDNKLETCRGCHEDAPEGYVEYWAHADAHDREGYPLLYWIWFAMVALIAGTFSFFGLHTLLWSVRGGLAALGRRRLGRTNGSPDGLRPVKRFERFHRVLHVFVMTSFIGLAMTGAPLKYSEAGWARGFLSLLGGVQIAGWLHRVFALVTFGYFFTHLGYVLTHMWRQRKRGLVTLLLGPDSMVPGWSDLKDMSAHFKWFLGMGPRPTWDRWTYWEKFDYWAVFWGVVIIGSSGLVMWFPDFFCSFLPGWIVNVALVIHSEEALLAICFIFIIHFFNSHLRIEKFPLDPVIFTGSVPNAEFVEERGREWERLKSEGRLEERRVDPPPRSTLGWLVAVGIAAWLTALALLLLIVYAWWTS